MEALQLGSARLSARLDLVLRRGIRADPCCMPPTLTPRTAPTANYFVPRRRSQGRLYPAASRWWHWRGPEPVLARAGHGQPRQLEAEHLVRATGQGVPKCGANVPGPVCQEQRPTALVCSIRPTASPPNAGVPRCSRAASSPFCSRILKRRSRACWTSSPEVSAHGGSHVSAHPRDQSPGRLGDMPWTFLSCAHPPRRLVLP
jgi:hypothetical protein